MFREMINTKIRPEELFTINRSSDIKKLLRIFR